jgi:hypothetical protein
MLGGIIATALCRLYFMPRYGRLLARYHPLPVPPEQRLAEVMLALPLLTLSYLWFGITIWPGRVDEPYVSYWVPMMSGLAQGCAIQVPLLPSVPGSAEHRTAHLHRLPKLPYRCIHKVSLLTDRSCSAR